MIQSTGLRQPLKFASCRGSATTTQFPPDNFQREDEEDDRVFYTSPRLVVHIDDQTIAAVSQLFQDRIPAGSVVLDLMSSWRSHWPQAHPKESMAGLGLNAEEMQDNPDLDDYVVHDVNRDPVLPFEDDTFDAVVVTVSIQYIVRPFEVFSDVCRVLKAGASFHVIYSNRMFPTKAVAVWQSLDDRQKAQLIASYFVKAGGWDEPTARDISPQMEFYTDPVYVVSARKKLGEG